VDAAEHAKKVKLKKALTRRYGKEKAREMRREADTVAAEYFEDRGSNALPELPGMTWKE
jgi:hypothetical protein